MIKSFRERLRSDSASGELISALFIIPLVVMLLFTMVDAAIYFNNRAQIQGIARDGARSVAIMGGDGTESTETTIEHKYGISRSAACSGVTGMESYTSSSSAIECNVMKTVNESSGLVNIHVKSVQCDPRITTSISQRTTCAIQWRYGSIPASGLSILKFKGGQGMAGDNLSIGTAESEVSLNDSSIVPRKG